MKWFKHDTDASIDAKLQSLLLDYGASGYGLYWYCVELIAQGVCENNITFELEHDARIIARNLNLSIIETQNMMQKMIELNLFSISENNKLACYTLAKRLDQSMTSNQGMRTIIHSLKTQNHDEVMTKSIGSHDKVMQEEKREDKSRLNIDASLIAHFKEETNAGEVAIKLMAWFIAYRKRIKKPIKTIAPMKLLITEMRKCINAGYKIEAMQELMEAKEWQSIKLEWVVKELGAITKDEWSVS